MGIFKKYNELKNNYEVLVRRNEDLYKRDIEHQKQYLAYLRKKDEEIAKLKIELEDTKGFLEQETAAKKELLRQRNIANNKKKVSKKKEVNNNGK